MDAASDPLGLVGTTIAEKYAVESVVGEGGFAVVYRAMHILWNRPVAVKVFKALDSGVDDRQRLLDDFVREGVLLAELSERTTGICQARDIGMLTCPKGQQAPYMVLEWLDGQPLDGLLASERASGARLRSLEEAIALLDPVGEALALAHKKGIAHRDVKPPNVFVLNDDRGVKLLDFGIAKVVQDAQKLGFGKTAGHITSFTPAYGAPEQFNRAYGATGPWTDVFALALVVVEVVSGREPLAGDNLVQLAYAAADPNTRPTPRTFGAKVTDEVEAIFVKALAVSPADRWQTAGEFWNTLRVAVTGQPMSSSFLGSARSSPSIKDAAASTTSHQPDANAATAVAPEGMIPMPPPAVNRGPLAEAATAPIAPAPPPKRSAMLLVAIGVVVLGGGAGAFALRSKAPPPPVPSVAPATPPPPPSVASAPATCPAGMVTIPGGEYFMGSDEKDAQANERPPHKVKLDPYCLDETEVTVAKYKECSDRGACLRAGRENAWTGITPAQQKIYDPLCNINDPTGRALHPINCVDWEQARKFCEARDARLPTEAEWEYAARGSDGRIFPWGDQPPSAQLLNACGKECVAWMKKNPDPDQSIAAMFMEDDGFANTAPVGSFPKGRSSWGVQDIVGNVWEWVADWYAPYGEDATAVQTAPKGPASGTDRVIRGGAWNGAMPAWVRPSWRFQAVPSFRTHGIGFRCAKSVAR